MNHEQENHHNRTAPLVWVAGHAQNISWRLEGSVENAAPNDTLTIIDNNRHEPLATLLVNDGTIVPASDTLDKPAVCHIVKKGRRGSIGANSSLSCRAG